MAETKPGRERNATRIAARYSSEIERDYTETARLHNKVGGFEGFFRVDATQPQEMRQMHPGIRRGEGIETTARVDQSAEFR